MFAFSFLEQRTLRDRDSYRKIRHRRFFIDTLEKQKTFLYSMEMDMTAYGTDNTTSDTSRNRRNYDAPHLRTTPPGEDIRSILLNRISWGAVSSGVAIFITVQLALNLVGFGIGAITPNYSVADIAAIPPFSTLSLVWWGMTGIIAACAGGYAAGRLSGERQESTAGWHGLTAWAASIFVVALMVLAGASTMIGGTVSVAGVLNPANAPTLQGFNMATTTTGALICATSLVLGAIGAWVFGSKGAVDSQLLDERLHRQSLH
jgi:hypothetical protein